MQKTLYEVVKLIVQNDLEPKAIELINSLFGKKILRNPKYKTFAEYVNGIELYSVWHDENLHALEFDKWASFYQDNDFPENWPWIYENEFFSSGRNVIKYFFRKNPNLINEFLEKQTLV